MERSQWIRERKKSAWGWLAGGCVVLLMGGLGLCLVGLAGDWVLYGLILLFPLLHFLWIRARRR